MSGVMETFDLSGRTAVITGGAGLLGRRHAEALAEAGAAIVLADIDAGGLDAAASELRSKFSADVMPLVLDITNPDDVSQAADKVSEKFASIDILINNAARNPKVGPDHDVGFDRFETFALKTWNDEIAVGLSGAFLCSQAFGNKMAVAGKGVILNIASDLGIIAPDQGLYSIPGKPASEQPVKPVTYSVIKSGLIGLTRYLATYWCDRGVRANALAPGGVEDGQNDEFLARIAQRIPMGRMAQPDEYKGAVVFMVSDASSYMNGAVLSIDGGRTCW